MNPELWQQIEPLYRAALQTPVEERSRFVAQACGSDSSLRRQLTGLLENSGEETSLGFEVTGHAAEGEFLPRNSGALAPGQILLHRFRIVRLLGSGGMGDVYEAVDLELGRIALKTIRSEIAATPEALARFKREVQLARKVSGPQVCRIHELFVIAAEGHAPARVFLTMEFLDGMTLSDKIEESGPVSWNEAKSIATSICAGLEAIHEAGIVHRDLKSRNVMMAKRKGAVCPVLMDFGLAHETIAAPSQQQKGEATGVTEPGQVIGTRDYMAPEQFQGKEVTPATDIYALGVVLYELLTGKSPFAAATPFEAAVLRGQHVAKPSAARKDLPRLADEVVAKCLAYKPERRYQTARAVSQTLEGKTRLRRMRREIAPFALGSVLMLSALAAVPAIRQRIQGMLLSSPEKHIAVLPFDISGNDANTQALGNGLMDSLSGELSDLNTSNQTLWVVPASEVRSSKVSDAAGALRQFGATIVVKGSVERHDSEVHLALTLIDTRKMRQIGFAQLDSPGGDLATLENEAVHRLGRLMNISVPLDKRDAAGLSNRAAYEDFLTGLGYMERYDKPGNLDRAIASMKKAFDTDDHFALALAEIGEAYRLKYLLDHNPQWLERAAINAAQAANIDRNEPAIFVILGQIHEATGKHDLAVQEFQRAIELDPRGPDALAGLAGAYDHAGRINEAESIYRRAIDLRPDYWDGYEKLGIFYDNHGKSALAIGEYRHAIALTPDNGQIYLNLGAAYINLGDSRYYPDAEQALKRSIELAPNYADFANLGYLYSLEHRYRESVVANEKSIEMNDHDYAAWSDLLSAYEWLREDSKAAVVRRKMLPLVEEAVRVNPLDTDAQVELATLYAHDRLVEKANSHIRTALAIDPNAPVVLSGAGEVFELLGQRPRAIQYLNMAFEKGYTLSEFMGDPELAGIKDDKELHLPSK